MYQYVALEINLIYTVNAQMNVNRRVFNAYEALDKEAGRGLAKGPSTPFFGRAILKVDRNWTCKDIERIYKTPVFFFYSTINMVSISKLLSSKEGQNSKGRNSKEGQN